MKSYNEPNERQKIWDDVLNLSIDKTECETKLQELFKFERYNSFFGKLENICSVLNKFTQKNSEIKIDINSMNEIIFLLLDSLIEFEYFHSFELKQDGYDYSKIKKDFQKIQKYLTNKDDGTIVYPVHPNINYLDTLKKISKYNIPKDDIENLLKIIFEVEKKPKMPKTHKKELYQVVKILEDFKQALIDNPELNDGYYNKSDNEKQQALIDIDNKIKKWKANINS
jgi:hypothetical protein